MTLLRVFISSPGDVAQERAVARRVMGRVQAAYAGRLRLEPVLWEQQPLLASDTFQAQLVPPSQADIVIAIVWSRLGTPLPASIARADGTRYRSGTEFEIEDALRAARDGIGPKLLLYRKAAQPMRWFASAEDALEAGTQRAALDAFLAGLLQDRDDGSFAGAFHPFASTADFEELVEIHLHKLVRELVPALVDDPLPAAASWSFGSPFRGLQSFELEHAPLFFGRTAVTAAAIDMLQAQARRGVPFLLLLGMSGGGKSSLAKAGVLSMLMQPGVVERARDWRYATLKPGDGRGDLVLALSDALRGASALPDLGDAAQVANAFRSAPQEAAKAVVQGLDSVGEATFLALIVDQLEEIFSDAAVSAVERELFAGLLDTLVRSGRVWVIATLRSDFYPRCVELPRLVAMKEGGQFDVEPPSPVEIGQIIRMPASAAGLRFETDDVSGEHLDERLRDVMSDRATALPLLEFTLEELYQRRTSDGMLTFEAYRAIGGLEGALAHRAEAVFAAQQPKVREALPRVLEPLVSTGEDDEMFGRRHAPMTSFADESARTLAAALIDARLLVSDLASDGVVQVSIAHEALVRHWPRAVEWLRANREMLRIRERVRAASLRWQQEERRNEYLITAGKPFAEAVMLRESGIALEAGERDFIEASDRRRRRSRSLRQGAVAALAVLSVAATAAAVFALRQADLARREAVTASRTSDFLTSLFSLADPSESRGTKVTARELLDRGASKIRTELRDEPLIRAGLLNTMGAAYSGLGLYDPALKLTAEARDQRVAKLGKFHPDAVRSQLAHAEALYLAGDYVKAEAAFREAQAMAARERDSVDRVRADLGLADVLTAAGSPEHAQPIYEGALRDFAKLAVDTRKERAFGHSGLASALYFQGKLDEADAAFVQARALGEDALGANHPKLLETTNNRASIAYQKADYDRARRLWEEVLPQYRDVFGPEHAEVAVVLNNLGRVALIERKFDAATTKLEAAIELDRRYKGPTHDDLILPLNSLGLARMGKGEHAQAAAAFAEAVAIAQKHEHWMLGVVMTNVADLHARQSDYAAAETASREARELLERAFPRNASKDEAWRYDLLGSIDGAILSNRGRLADAQPLLVDAVDRLAARFGESSLFAVDAMRRASRHLEKTRDTRLAAMMSERLRRAERNPT